MADTKPTVKQGFARELIDSDIGRNQKFSDAEKIVFNEIEPPSWLQQSNMDWFIWAKETKPAISVQKISNLFTALSPRINHMPLASESNTRRIADKIENILGSEFRRANRRTKRRPLELTMKSAVMYDAAAVRVIYLPYEIRVRKKLGQDTSMLERALSYGYFAYDVYNPKTIHSVETIYGLQEVVRAEVMKMSQVIAFYGEERCRTLIESREKDKQLQYAYVIDCIDPKERWVWAYPVASANDVPPADGQNANWIYKGMKHGRDFLNWSVRSGSSWLDTDPKRQYHTMLDVIMDSNQWELSTVLRSVFFSDILAMASAPRGIIEGPNKELVEVDYGDPIKPIYVPPGHSYRELNPPTIDAQLINALERVARDIDNATAPESLFGNYPPQGMAFATLSAIQQSAVHDVEAFKKLAEGIWGDVFDISLRQIKAEGQDVIYFPARSKKIEDYTISPHEIVTDHIDLEVELQADLPVDRIGRINGAAMLVERFDYSKRRALEATGVTDADIARAERQLEIMEEAELAQTIQEDAALRQLKMSIFTLQTQSQMMPPAPTAQPGGPVAPPTPGSELAGVPGAEGTGFATNAGGQSAEMLMPGSSAPMDQRGLA